MSKTPDEVSVETAKTKNLQQIISESVDKILDGTITPKETKDLYEAFENTEPKHKKHQTIENFLEDLNKTISSDKLHDFVGKLIEVEKQVVTERSANAPNPVMKKSSDFLRNSSLARNALIKECQNNEFGKKEFEVLKQLDKKKTIGALVDIKIPPFLQEHYSSIKDYYQEIGNPKGAVTNLTFHTLNSSITRYCSKEFAGAELTKHVKEYNDCYRATFNADIAESLSVIDKQISRDSDTRNIDTKGLKNDAINRYKAQSSEKMQGMKPKTLGQRFKEFKNKLSNKPATTEEKKREEKKPELKKLEEKKPFTIESYAESLINNPNLSALEKVMFNELQQFANKDNKQGSSIDQNSQAQPKANKVERDNKPDPTISQNSSGLSKTSKIEMDNFIELFKAGQLDKHVSYAENTNTTPSTKGAHYVKEPLQRKNAVNSKSKPTAVRDSKDMNKSQHNSTNKVSHDSIKKWVPAKPGKGGSISF